MNSWWHYWHAHLLCTTLDHTPAHSGSEQPVLLTAPSEPELEPGNWRPISWCSCTVILAGEMCHLRWAAKWSRKAYTCSTLCQQKFSPLTSIRRRWAEAVYLSVCPSCRSEGSTAHSSAWSAPAAGRLCAPHCHQSKLHCLTKPAQWGIFP